MEIFRRKVIFCRVEALEIVARIKNCINIEVYLNAVITFADQNH